MTIQKRIAVLSGKGGVGKSVVSSVMAKVLSDKNKRVLFLDFDICGPSIPRLLNNHDPVKFKEGKLMPIEINENLSFFSFGNIIKPDDAVIWRGPKKESMLTKIINSLVKDSDYDFIIMDTPPGISEEHKKLIELNVEIFIVTSPQNLSLNDAQRSIEFSENNNLEIKGVIQTMSGIECECCQEMFYPFGKRGGELLADEHSLKLLTTIDIDLKLQESIENCTFFNNLPNFKIYADIAKILKNLYL